MPVPVDDNDEDDDDEDEDAEDDDDDDDEDDATDDDEELPVVVLAAIELAIDTAPPAPPVPPRPSAGPRSTTTLPPQPNMRAAKTASRARRCVTIASYHASISPVRPGSGDLLAFRESSKERARRF